MGGLGGRDKRKLIFLNPDPLPRILEKYIKGLS
jgi:hypothetical protein